MSSFGRRLLALATLAVAGMLMLPGCCTCPRQGELPDVAFQYQGEPVGSWSLDHVEAADGTVLDTPVGFALSLLPGGRVSAEGGCNTCFGSWAADNDSHRSGTIQIGCTKKGCEPELQEASNLVFELHTWHVEGNTMVMPAGDRRVVLRPGS